jgi:hypothetical protein
MTKRKRTINHLQDTMQITKDRATRTTQETGEELRCSQSVSGATVNQQEEHHLIWKIVLEISMPK